MLGSHYLHKWVPVFGPLLLSFFERLDGLDSEFNAAIIGARDSERGANSICKIFKKDSGEVRGFQFDAASFAKLTSSMEGAEEMPIPFVNWCFGNLAKNGCCYHTPAGTFGSYAILPDRIVEYKQRGILDAACLGYRCLADSRKAKIAEIIVEDDVGLATGTGFLLRLRRYSEEKSRILTCKHVIFDANNKPRKISVKVSGESVEIKDVTPFSRIDACILDPVSSLDERPLAAHQVGVLDKVFTAGYPRLLMKDANPLLWHSGEVNGWVGSVADGSHQGVTSAQVAPGNSGGPVFDQLGQVCGMVSQEIAQINEGIAGSHKHNLFISIEQIMHEIDQENFDDSLQM